MSDDFSKTAEPSAGIQRIDIGRGQTIKTTRPMDSSTSIGRQARRDWTGSRVAGGPTNNGIADGHVKPSAIWAHTRRKG